MAVLIEAESENKKTVSQKFVWDQLAVRIPGDNKKTTETLQLPLQCSSGSVLTRFCLALLPGLISCGNVVAIRLLF